jgi:hemerythrin-like domain-containing protein
MKRSKNLHPLSRQHHNALMAVLLLKKGLRKQADLNVLNEFILSLWNDELNLHFETEEKVLQHFRLLSALDIYYQQMLDEHNAIREMIQLFFSNRATAALVEKFYNTLELHIRFEERILFPAIEANVSFDELQSATVYLSALNGKSCINFPVKFWE